MTRQISIATPMMGRHMLREMAQGMMDKLGAWLFAAPMPSMAAAGLPLAAGNDRLMRRQLLPLTGSARLAHAHGHWAGCATLAKGGVHGHRKDVLMSHRQNMRLHYCLRQPTPGLGCK